MLSEDRVATNPLEGAAPFRRTVPTHVVPPPGEFGATVRL